MEKEIAEWYELSTDYGWLYNLIRNDVKLVVLIDHDYYGCTTVCLFYRSSSDGYVVDRVGEGRWIYRAGCISFGPFDKSLYDHDEKEFFIKECRVLNIRFVKPDKLPMKLWKVN